MTAAAGVRSLHNCLRLDRVIRGVKREQGTGTRPRLPITAAILRRSNTFLTHSIIATHCSGQRVAPVSLAFCAVENSRQLLLFCTETRMFCVEIELLRRNVTLFRGKTHMFRRNTAVLRRNMRLLRRNTAVLRRNMRLLRRNTAVLRRNIRLLRRNTAVLR